MKKFEYKTVNVPTKGWMKYKLDTEALEQLLNDFGKVGWEAVISMGNVYQEGSNPKNVILLKREIIQ